MKRTFTGRTVREFAEDGYKAGDIKFERGYISRKTVTSESPVFEAGGSRKGQFYALAPCDISTRYCYRVYLVK